MKKNGMKVMAMIGSAVMAAGMLAGCGNSGAAATTAATATTAEQTTEAKAEETTKEAATEAKSADADLSGSISMVGSTSMEKFANALSEAFMEKYPKVTVTAEFVGSGAGIEAVSNGTADIGNSSRNLKDEEKAKGVAENIVAIDGIAVVVDPANTVEDLTKDQLTSIYDGSVTNWKDVGGNDAPIVVVGREAGSGTRGAFEELLKLEDACKYSNELDSTGAVMAKVASTPGSIGYVSLDVLDDTVKAVKIDGAEASVDNVKNGSYKVVRPFNIVLGKKASDAANDFVSYIMSAEGQKIVQDNGYIPVDEAAASYKATGAKGKVVVGGSSSVSPVMEKLVEAYSKANTNIQVDVQTTDSTTGVSSTVEGSYDIGMASRDLKDDETSQGVEGKTIAKDGIAVVVNNDNSVDELSTDQVKSIFTGETTSWSDVSK